MTIYRQSTSQGLQFWTYAGQVRQYLTATLASRYIAAGARVAQVRP